MNPDQSDGISQYFEKQFSHEVSNYNIDLEHSAITAVQSENPGDFLSEIAKWYGNQASWDQKRVAASEIWDQPEKWEQLDGIIIRESGAMEEIPAQQRYAYQLDGSDIVFTKDQVIWNQEERKNVKESATRGLKNKHNFDSLADISNRLMTDAWTADEEVSWLLKELASLKQRLNETDANDITQEKIIDLLNQKIAISHESLLQTADKSLTVVEFKGQPENQDRIGRHGVIITKLVEEGVSIDDSPLRKGLDTKRSVSKKSGDQYAYDFKNLFDPTLSASEKLLPATAQEKLRLAKEARIPILKLITLAYMPDNPSAKQFLQLAVDLQEGAYLNIVRPALAYLRYLVEKGIGDAIDGTPDPEIAKLGDPTTLEQSLKKILENIKKDNIRIFKPEDILQKGIPSGSTNNIEERDTLHLGLLIRQFHENAKARNAHRIDELVKRFS